MRLKYFFVHGVVEFECAPVFKEFVEHYYNKRLVYKKQIADHYSGVKELSEADLAMAMAMSKSLKDTLNSLYGKFGQRFFDKTTIVTAREFDKMRKEGVEIQDFKPMFPLSENEEMKYMVYERDFKHNCKAIGNLVYIASFITACARHHLTEMIYDAGCKNAMYCDTDSLYFKYKKDNKPDFKYLDDIDPCKLGALDSEIEGNKKCDNIVVTECYFNAPKFYGARIFKKDVKGDWTELKPKIKSKGITSGKIDFKQLKSLNIGKPAAGSLCGDSVARSTPGKDGKGESPLHIEVKVRNFVRHFDEGKVIVTPMIKKVKCVYDKRNVCDNGVDTHL